MVARQLVQRARFECINKATSPSQSFLIVSDTFPHKQSPYRRTTHKQVRIGICFPRQLWACCQLLYCACTCQKCNAYLVRGAHTFARGALFVWLIGHQTTVLFSQNKPATSNQPAVLFSQNKPAPAISHQPTEQALPKLPSSEIPMV
jgi:hypothetical protein